MDILKNNLRIKIFYFILPVFLLTGSILKSQSINVPLIVTDGVATDTVYLGVDTTATNSIDPHLNEYELPPSPPPGVFETRFTSDATPPVNIGEGSKRDYRQGTLNTTGTRNHKLKYQIGTGTYIRISWTNVIPQVKIRIQDPVTGNLIDTTVTAAGSYQIPAIYLALGKLSLTVYYDPTIYLNLNFIPEGFYNTSTGRLNMKDTVRVTLRSVVAPYPIIDSSVAVIDSVSFSGIFTFKIAPTGNYYIVANHRNCIETWSKSGGINIVRGSSPVYDFTSSVVQAYGNNLKLKGSKYCIYSGDVIRNGIINLVDITYTYNDAATFIKGYQLSDVTGDRITNLADIVNVFNNSATFVVLKRP